MIATWMLYTALVGVLVVVAADAMERIAAARGWPRRAIWAGALGIIVAWPALEGLSRLVNAAKPVTLSPFVVTVQPLDAIADSGFRAAVTVVLDRGLVALWIALSAFVLARLVHGMVALSRRRASWAPRDIDGHRVRLSANVGPAVVGLRPMDVVVPEWIVTLDAPLRAIVLRHEEEHRGARDPYLLFAGAIAVALMPWNPAIWYLARRLRLAIEIDCDARVLRVHPSAERYGLLMLTVAQQRGAAPTAFAPTLSEPASNLERRILAMRTVTRRFMRLTIIGGSVVAAGALALACSLVSDGPTAASPSRSQQRAGPMRMSDNQVFFEYQVEQQVQPLPTNRAPRYPDVLRQANVEGEVLAQFVVGKDGTPDMATFKVLKSKHALFTAAVRTALPNMRFSPARVGGMAVKQLVQMPFQFALATHSVEDAKTPVGGAPAPVRLEVDSAQLQRAPGSARPDAAAPPQYQKFRIDRSAEPMPNNRAPHYPDMLRAAHVEGQVVAQFVVGSDGVPDPATFKVLKSTHDLFTVAVRNALATMRFHPATVAGHAVKQLVTMPFDFALPR